MDHNFAALLAFGIIAVAVVAAMSLLVIWLP
jgi:hypothetical protein